MDGVTEAAPREVRCPRCSGLFTPDQVRAANPTARCSFCGTELLVRQPPPEPPRAPPPPPPAMPPFFEVLETESPRIETVPGDPYRSAPVPRARPHLTIRWSHRHALWPLLVFCAIWWAFVIAFLIAGHWQAIGHALAGAVLLGYVIVTAVNHTYVRVDSSAIVWSSEPIPVWTKRRIELAEVDQLFAVREVEQRRNGESVRFRVRVKTRTGKDRKIADVDTADQARWLEYAIERHLGIEDRPVEGELPRATEGAS